MKTRFSYGLALLLLSMFACQPTEEILELQNSTQEDPESPIWEVPLQLTDDWEADLKALDKLAEITRDQVGISIEKHRNVAFLQAGSVDELQAKVNAVGPGGTVVLRRGNHYESTTVTVSHRVNIIGLRGAVIHSGARNIFTVGKIEPAIHVLNADYSVIAGIKFLSSIGPQDGGVGLLIEDSKHVLSALNRMEGFLYGILLEQSDRNYILGNKIVLSDLALSQFIDGNGIIVINGQHTKIKWNNISNGIFGIWASDKKGLIERNHLHDNFIGLILCNIPAQSYPLPDGNVVGSDFPGAFWTVKNNISWDNLDAGYMASDGANNNVIKHNKAFRNGTYDVDLVGDSQRFGFFTPTSSDNTVIAGPFNILIKDCGTNSTVIGGTQVDIIADPCF